VLHLYSARRARPAAACLAGVLAAPPADPFTPEWLAVPSDGMRRWLALELARRLGASDRGGDGVAANIVRAYPGTLRSCVLGAGRGDGDPDPWTIDRLVWSVLRAFERGVDDPTLSAFSALAPGASRYARARRVADLFDRYHLHRPDMVRSWSVGSDVGGTGDRLSDHDAWQPHLWRLVRQEVGEPSPPERWPELLDRLARGELALDVPPRLVLFGFTLLPGGGFLELVRAVAEHRDVHLFLLEPSRLDAGGLRRTSPRRSVAGRRLRADDATAEVTVQPLLRSWGRLHRETALLLADAEADGLPGRHWVDEEGGERPASLLGRLQYDIRTNGAVSVPKDLDPADNSLRFHACFGPTRQVEALRDALLHLLNEPGSDLSEDDILVLCPNLERFAPLIQAVLGPSAESPAAASTDPERRGSRAGAPGVRYRIADQSIRSTNPFLSATTALFDLVAGRFESTAVLDFLALGPVRARFRFDDEDLDDIAGWVIGTNVRWGVDPVHRQSFDLPESIRTNTWHAALERLLVGSTVADHDLTLAIGEVAPYGVEGGRTEIVGRLAEALWHLHRLAVETRVARPITQWVRSLREACDGLFATDRTGRWQAETLHRIFDEVLESATAHGAASTVPLEFVDIRRLFDERLEAKPGRPDYFRGGITVSSMTPLRWIPFRVVCLLGMDQSAFGPMAGPGDDLSAAAPEVGDPDPRSEARQSLLEAVLAAGEHLMVLRDGHDVRTNQVVPRSVVVAELFDAVSSLVGDARRAALAEQLEIQHPRQPFDERCFEAGALVPGVVWGFDGGNLAGARARRHRAPGHPPFLPTPLGPSASTVVELDQLQAFFRNPAAYFIGRRLEARLPRRGEEPSAILPVELDGLARWQVATRMLTARLAGVDTEVWRAVERARGTLPPGSLGDRVVETIADDVDALVAAASALGVRSGPGEPFEIDVTLSGGTRIVGAVPLRLSGPHPGPVRVGYSKVKAQYRVNAWLELMVLVASDPTRTWRSAVVGRGAGSGAPADVFDIEVAGVPATWTTTADRALEVAVDCYHRGLREPVPLFADFSYEVYRGTATPATWSNDRTFPDGVDPAVVLAFGGIGFDEVIDLAPRPGDPGDRGDRVSRFAQYLFGAMDGSVRLREPTPGTGAPTLPAGAP
jgi:exodeoxyribonuclease V gamma subunit